jgi:hypothetical protein
MENILLATLGGGQEIAAVCAEDQGADRSHGVVAVAWSIFTWRISSEEFQA